VLRELIEPVPGRPGFYRLTPERQRAVAGATWAKPISGHTLTASNGWQFTIAGPKPDQRRLDEMGAEARVEDAEADLRQAEDLLGCDEVVATDHGIATAERMIDEARAKLDDARRELASMRVGQRHALRSPCSLPMLRPMMWRLRRPRERRFRPARRSSSRAGPDSEDPEPAGGRPHDDLARSAP
jgi:hypothetical protein